RYALFVAGYALRPGILVSLVLLGFMLWHSLVVERKPLFIDTGVLILAFLIGVNYLASAANAPVKSESFKEATLLMLLVLPSYLLAINLIKKPADLQFACMLWVSIAVAESLFGLLAMAVFDQWG